MPRVWFCFDGPEPTYGAPAYVMALEECVRLLALSKSQHIAGPEEVPRFNVESPLGKFGGTKHVVVEILESEASGLGWRAGCYLLPLEPREVIERVGRAPDPPVKEAV